jgi:hypothetical protein
MSGQFNDGFMAVNGNSPATVERQQPLNIWRSSAWSERQQRVAGCRSLLIDAVIGL